MRLKYHTRSAEQHSRLANFLSISLIAITIVNFSLFGLYRLGAPPISRFIDSDQRKTFMKYKEDCERNPALAYKLGGTDITTVDEVLCAERLFRDSNGNSKKEKISVVLK